MKKVTEITIEDIKAMSFDAVLETSTWAINKLTEEELEVFDIIAEHIDEVPLALFQKSLDEINKFYGGHDDMMVNENIRLAMFWHKAELGLILAEADALEELAKIYSSQ